MSDYLDPNNEELLKDFYSEADLQVELLEQNILAIEDNPGDADAIDEIFRAAHTLKGGSATVQINELAEFTHIIEDLLDEIRSDKVKVNSHVVDVLLESIDIIKAMLGARKNGEVFGNDIESTKKSLHSFMDQVDGSTSVSSSTAAKKESFPSAAPSGSVDASGVNSGFKLSEYDILELKEAAGTSPVYCVKVRFDENNPMNSVGGIQVFARIKAIGKALKTDPDFDSLYEDKFHPEVIYYISSDENRENIEKSLSIPDVTLEVNASLLSQINSFSSETNLSEPEVKVEEAVIAAPRQDPVIQNVSAASAQAESGSQDAIDSSIEEIRRINNEITEATPAPKEEVPENKAPVKSNKYKENSGSSILRVDSQRIDNLLNLVSEAVINKATFNQISTMFADLQNEFQSSETQFKERLKNLFDEIPGFLEDIDNDRSVKEIKTEIEEKYSSLFAIYDTFNGKFKNIVSTFRNTAGNLGRNTGDLHEGILRIRMVPINQIFSRFPRLVRDLSKSLNKKIDLVIEGEDTELDKSVIEELLDPLMHCVRNSLDHGIETPEERKAAGKSPTGKLLLKASNEGNMIIIEISDDGAGINVESVRKKAVSRGLIHPSKNLSDIEAFNMIFEPGFSTAKSVTNISGRGVGLDVVRKEIEKLNGSVSVWSNYGEGSKFTIKLPLTLAIIQGLLVRVGTEIYAIPITSVVESLRIKPKEIRVIDNYEVINVRDDVISLIRLNKLFGLPSEEEKAYTFVVIVGSGDKKMGLMVDSLIGEEDVVIKPLKDNYTNSPGIAGATILGDGTVSLIIDVAQLLDLGVQMEQEARQIQEKLVRG